MSHVFVDFKIYKKKNKFERNNFEFGLLILRVGSLEFIFWYKIDEFVEGGWYRPGQKFNSF